MQFVTWYNMCMQASRCCDLVVSFTLGCECRILSLAVSLGGVTGSDIPSVACEMFTVKMHSDCAQVVWHQQRQLSTLTLINVGPNPILGSKERGEARA